MEWTDQEIKELFKSTERELDDSALSIHKSKIYRLIPQRILHPLAIAASISTILMVWSQGSVIEEIYTYTADAISSYESYLIQWNTQITR